MSGHYYEKFIVFGRVMPAASKWQRISKSGRLHEEESLG
jgi:hypothetical protein